MTVSERTEEATYRQFVQEKLTAIHTQTTLTNGRLRSAEIKIAVLQVGYLVGAAFCLWLLNRITS